MLGKYQQQRQKSRMKGGSSFASKYQAAPSVEEKCPTGGVREHLLLRRRAGKRNGNRDFLLLGKLFNVSKQWWLLNSTTHLKGVHEPPYYSTMVVGGKNLDVSLISDFLDFANDRKHDRSRPWYGRDGWATTYLVNSSCVRALWREPCCYRIKNEIKGMVKLILPRIKVNASVRIIFPSTFVVDGVKRLRMRSMRSRSRMWRSALLARR